VSLGACFLVEPPNGVEIACWDFFDEPAFKQALEAVTNRAAFDLGGDRKNKAIITGACGAQDDGLGIGKLDLVHDVPPFWTTSYTLLPARLSS
jgi:hypothetical protein